MKASNQYIIEKLKVTKDSYEADDELFAKVIDALKYYPDGDLDVKELKLICAYTYCNSKKITSSVKNIYYYNNLYASNKEYMVLTLDNGVYMKIDKFKTFNELVSSQTKESSEEILNNILELINNYYGAKYI